MNWLLPFLGGLATALCALFLHRALNAFRALRLSKKPETMALLEKHGYSLPPRTFLWKQFGGNCLGFLITTAIWVTFAVVIFK